MVKCDICGKELKNKRGLKIHKSKAHKDEKNKKKREKKNKEAKKREKTVKVCPKCGSPRIDFASMNTKSIGTVIGLGTPNKYYCKDCGYEGLIRIEASAEEIERMKDETRKRLRKEEKIKRKKTPLILKPLSIVLILGFLITAIFIAMNPIGTETSSYIPIGQRMEEEPLNVTEEKEANLMEEPYDIYPETESIRRATGITIIGFLVPLFIIFFLIGLLVYLIWYYLERITHHK
ncbi:MAG: hypothetical protein ACOCTT_00395, partial [archaeon]